MKERRTDNETVKHCQWQIHGLAMQSGRNRLLINELWQHLEITTGMKKEVATWNFIQAYSTFNSEKPLSLLKKQSPQDHGLLIRQASSFILYHPFCAAMQTTQTLKRDCLTRCWKAPVQMALWPSMWFYAIAQRAESGYQVNAFLLLNIWRFRPKASAMLPFILLTSPFSFNWEANASGLDKQCRCLKKCLEKKAFHVSSKGRIPCPIAGTPVTCSSGWHGCNINHSLLISIPAYPLKPPKVWRFSFCS